MLHLYILIARQTEVRPPGFLLKPAIVLLECLPYDQAHLIIPCGLLSGSNNTDVYVFVSHDSLLVAPGVCVVFFSNSTVVFLIFKILSVLVNVGAQIKKVLVLGTERIAVLCLRTALLDLVARLQPNGVATWDAIGDHLVLGGAACINFEILMDLFFCLIVHLYY